MDNKLTNDIECEIKVRGSTYGTVKRINLEAKSCLEGGLIEGLSRMEQLKRDFVVMRKCGFVDEEIEQELIKIVKQYYDAGFIIDCGKPKKISEVKIEL